MTRLFTGIFAMMASAMAIRTTGEFLSTPGGMALAGMLFGVALWLVNFYIVAPLLGWSWFPEGTNPTVQFLAHALFFGAPVGWLLGRSRAALAM